MTLTALIAMLVIAVIAVPVVALAQALWAEIPSSGLGDIFPDERLLDAIKGSSPAEQELWT